MKYKMLIVLYPYLNLFYAFYTFQCTLCISMNLYAFSCVFMHLPGFLLLFLYINKALENVSPPDSLVLFGRLPPGEVIEFKSKGRAHFPCGRRSISPAECLQKPAAGRWHRYMPALPNFVPDSRARGYIILPIQLFRSGRRAGRIRKTG